MGVSVTDDSFGESKPSVQVVEIEFGDLRACYCGRAGKEYCTLGTAMVDDSEDSIVPLAIG